MVHIVFKTKGFVCIVAVYMHACMQAQLVLGTDLKRPDLCIFIYWNLGVVTAVV